MKILGIGNAIVDVICKVDDNFISKNNLTKSTMKLVDENEFKKLLSILKIEDIRPVLGFKSSGVNATSLHSNLLGLSSDDHTQYLLEDGARAMSDNLVMGSNSITVTSSLFI